MLNLGTELKGFFLLQDVCKMLNTANKAPIAPGAVSSALQLFPRLQAELPQDVRVQTFLQSFASACSAVSKEESISNALKETLTQSITQVKILAAEALYAHLVDKEFDQPTPMQAQALRAIVSLKMIGEEM